MKNKISLLRICYWWGIILDAAMAFLMLFPNLFVRFMNINLEPSPNFGFGLINGAPLMIGWTILLFWADRKPLERKDILLLTIPVLVGYILVEGYALWAGLAPLRSTLLAFTMQAGLSSLFIYSWMTTRGQ